MKKFWNSPFPVFPKIPRIIIAKTVCFTAENVTPQKKHSLQRVSPLTAQTNNIASQKLRYEADSAATKAAADKASYQAQLQNQQVASTAGNKLNTLLQNPSSVESTPGYQFAYNQGLEAVNRTAAAKGQLGSGNRLYDLTKFGQGLASQTYNSTVNQLGNFLNKTPMAQSMSNYQTNANGTTTFGGTY